jgi:hypothetical protein
MTTLRMHNERDHLIKTIPGTSRNNVTPGVTVAPSTAKIG